MITWFKLVLVFLLFGCTSVSKNHLENSTISQGISGTVIVREGNFMPGPSRFPHQPQPTGKAAVREIWIYERTHQGQAKFNNGFYSAIQNKLVTKVTSDKNGRFQIALKPGVYSLFSKEPAGLFANRENGEGIIYPVEVKAGQVTAVEFVVDYQASY